MQSPQAVVFAATQVRQSREMSSEENMHAIMRRGVLQSSTSGLSWNYSTSRNSRSRWLRWGCRSLASVFASI